MPLPQPMYPLYYQDAISIMLQSVGRAPIPLGATLLDAVLSATTTPDLLAALAVLDADVVIAINLLMECVTEVQLRGWRFNTNRNYAITADPGNSYFVAIPATTLRLKLSTDYCAGYTFADLSFRQGKMWDLKNNTFVFAPGTTFRFEIVFAVDYNLCPQSIRSLIAKMAARKFAHQVLGDRDAGTYTEEDEQQAIANAVIADGEEDSANMLDNLASQAAVNRFF